MLFHQNLAKTKKCDHREKQYLFAEARDDHWYAKKSLPAEYEYEHKQQVQSDTDKVKDP